MIREDEGPERRIEKLERINRVLIDRIKRLDDRKGSAHSMFQAAMALEREVTARKLELEQALTDLRQKNEELATARTAAEAANRSKTRFLSAASHDLLQPISAARLFLSTLNDTDLDPLQVELVDRISAAFHAVEDLMRAVLDISRLDPQSMNIRFNVGPVALGPTLSRLAREFQPSAAAKGLTLRHVPTTAIVDSDPVYLRRIVQNLLSNAIRYTDRGKVLLGVRRRARDVVVEVLDTGVGIASHDLDRVFEEFNRGTSAPSQPGMGLGLSIVRRACTMLGHGVELDSIRGGGTVVRITLPLSTSSRAAPAVPQFSFVRGAGLAGRAVIVIENDVPLRRAYEILLGKQWNMLAYVVGTTAEALALDCRPEVIVADFHLDEHDTGLRSIRRLRAQHGRRLPALLVTAHADEVLAQTCARENVQILAKPVRKRDLRHLLMGILSRSECDSA